RLWLVRRYRAAAPLPARRAQWGRAWAVGSMLAGALWGAAGVVLFVPGDPGHQALLIVCLFGVILGGINLVAVQSLVLRLRPAGAGPAYRARSNGSRSSSCFHRRRHAGGLGFPSRIRSQPEQCAHAIARDPL